MLPSTIAADNTEVMHVINGHAALPSSSLLAKKGAFTTSICQNSKQK